MKQISENVLSQILLSVLNETSKENHIHIGNCIVNNMNDKTIDLLLHIALSNSTFKTIMIEDYVKVIPSYTARNSFNYDTMQEMGLMCSKTNMIYGKVTGDSSWESSYNPYYGSFKIDVMLHDDNKNIKILTDTYSNTELTLVSKSEIMYFKYLEYGKNQ